MGDLIMENNNVQSIIIGCIIVVVVMVLLYVIISLIADHIEETKKAKKILERHQELKVLFIYTDDKGAMKLWKSVNTNTLTHGTGR